MTGSAIELAGGKEEDGEGSSVRVRLSTGSEGIFGNFTLFGLGQIHSKWGYRAF